MQVFKLSQAELDTLIAAWRQTARVYRPSAGKQATRPDDCAPGWTQLTDTDSIPLELPLGPAKASVKTFLFPQPETMMRFTLKNDAPEKALMLEPATPARKQIVVGIRPCDARSVVLNNLPFRDDPLYQANLERTVLVGFTCATMAATCFCDEVGGSPMASEGLDIAISPVNGRFVAEILTAKGEELVAAATLAPAAPDDVAALAELRAQAPWPRNRKLDVLKGQSLNKLYDAPCWQGLGESCINCGACTFICPTCYCFDIQDEVSRGQGRRIRCWDSCMFPLYSLHTSGHNPRGKKMQRTRNRFMHKLKYFPDRFGPFSCVGCGRCVQDCPVNIDIREVMHDLLTVE